MRTWIPNPRAAIGLSPDSGMEVAWSVVSSHAESGHPAHADHYRGGIQSTRTTRSAGRRVGPLARTHARTLPKPIAGLDQIAKSRRAQQTPRVAGGDGRAAVWDSALESGNAAHGSRAAAVFDRSGGPGCPFAGPIGPHPTAMLTAAFRHLHRTRRDWDVIDFHQANPTDMQHRRLQNAFRLVGWRCEIRPSNGGGMMLARKDSGPPARRFPSGERMQLPPVFVTLM